MEYVCRQQGQFTGRRAAAVSERCWYLTVPAVGCVVLCCSWTIPSNIPVSAFGGQSLFGLFTQQIGTELANFPTGPSIDSPFWLYMITWHMGLFACIFWCVLCLAQHAACWQLYAVKLVAGSSSATPSWQLCCLLLAACHAVSRPTMC
jgi:photosystem I subunit PsaO